MIYSKYRRTTLSADVKAVLCAAAIAFLWLAVSEMDYREQVRCEAGK